ncbi:FHIPEP family type III secretion protein [Qipengyuania sp. DGS5-3]|uniref:FHIPEP family type III secretion protein n=1 Tax=Qipengyuania sp. DGS5-3 TaxID=3349632 RepID=UPI0036D32974
MELAAKMQRALRLVPTAQLVVILGLVAIFAMFILPMPPAMLDVFIAINLTIAALLVIAVIGVKHPLDFSTFPSILLFTTVARLAISIATTRMILTEMDGGQIISEFGETAAGGNIVVGLVVFLIITVVQFIVISKGSERVAEVCARFSLDAMPGKQLSIDSDLRSGMLTKEEAKTKRNTLEQESRLYGSLDGAMKFVKGDAIASVVIVVINLIGGIAVGAIYHGLSLSEAAGVFSILTIGDGLVAQIPAFLCALAAGLLVTRSNDPESKPDLAPAIFAEAGAKPGTLIAAGTIAFALGLIPGFPFAIFCALGLTLILAGVWRHPITGPKLTDMFARADALDGPAPEEIVLRAQPAPRVEPLVLHVSTGEVSAGEMARLTDALERAKSEVQERSGIALPALRVAKFASDEPVGSWELTAFDAPLGAAREDPRLLEERLPIFVRELLRRNLPLLLGLQEVTDLLDYLGETHPEVVKETVRAVPVQTIVEVLRMLADEQVSLRNLRDCIEAICEAGQAERDATPIAAKVRVALRRNIVAPLCESGRLKVVMIGPRAEEAIRHTLTAIDGQPRLAIDPLRMRELVRLIGQEVEAGGARAILTAQDLRRPLRLICAADLFDVPVLSFNELNPAVPLDVVRQLDVAPDLVAHTSSDEFQMEAAE